MGTGQVQAGTSACGWGVRIRHSEGIQNETQPGMARQGHGLVLGWPPDPSARSPSVCGALVAQSHIHHTGIIYGHTCTIYIHHNTLHMHIWCIYMHTHRGTLIESIKSSLCNIQVLLIINHRRLISFYLKSKILSLLYSNQYIGIISQSPWIFIPKI